MSCFENWRSSATAASPSRHLRWIDTSVPIASGWTERTSCWVMVEPPDDPAPPAMISAPRAMAIRLDPLVAPEGRVLGGDGGVDQVGRDLLEGDERPPAVVLIGDLLQEHAVAVENAGRLEDVR